MKEPLDLFETLYNTADVPLGSLVPDMAQPHEDNWPPMGLQEGTDFSVKINKNISWRTDSFSYSRFSVQMLSWLKALSQRDKHHHFRVTAKRGSIYHLKQPNQALRAICEDPKGREWLEDAAGSGPVHMVTELCTMDHPVLERIDAKGRRLEGQVPITDGTVTYGGAAGGRDGGSSVERNLVASGERIYKIKFRRVKLTFRTVKDGEKTIGSSALKRGYCWKPMLVSRGEETADGGELMVEADLEDEEDEEEEEEEKEEEEEEEEVGNSGESDEYDEEGESEGSFFEDEEEEVEEEDEEARRGPGRKMTTGLHEKIQE